MHRDAWGVGVEPPRYKTRLSFLWLWASVCLCASSTYSSAVRKAFLVVPSNICMAPTVFHVIKYKTLINV